MEVKKSPGRPKKYASLEKAAEATKEIPVAQDVSELNRTALGIGKNEDGKWTVYVFKFDPLSKEIALEKEISEESHRSATYWFKKEAAMNILKTK